MFGYRATADGFERLDELGERKTNRKIMAPGNKKKVGDGTNIGAHL
jgi:hypothetical protein